MIPSFDAGSMPDEWGRAFQQDRLVFFRKVAALFFCLARELAGRYGANERRLNVGIRPFLAAAASLAAVWAACRWGRRSVETERNLRGLENDPMGRHRREFVTAPSWCSPRRRRITRGRHGSALARVLQGQQARATQSRRSIHREKAMSLLRRGPRSIPRAARRMWWLVADLFRLWQRAPELTIDARRLNDELRRSALAGLDDDMTYRERVKQRMRDGARCAYPALINRSKLRSFETFRRGASMGRAAAAPAGSPRTDLVEWYGL